MTTDPDPDYMAIHLAIDARNGARRLDPDADLRETQESPVVSDEEVIAELGREA